MTTVLDSIHSKEGKGMEWTVTYSFDSGRGNLFRFSFSPLSFLDPSFQETFPLKKVTHTFEYQFFMITIPYKCREEKKSFDFNSVTKIRTSIPFSLSRWKTSIFSVLFSRSTLTLKFFPWFFSSLPSASSFLSSSLFHSKMLCRCHLFPFHIYIDSYFHFWEKRFKYRAKYRTSFLFDGWRKGEEKWERKNHEEWRCMLLLWYNFKIWRSWKTNLFSNRLETSLKWKREMERG